MGQPNQSRSICTFSCGLINHKSLNFLASFLLSASDNTRPSLGRVKSEKPLKMALDI